VHTKNDEDAVLYFEEKKLKEITMEVKSISYRPRDRETKVVEVVLDDDSVLTIFVKNPAVAVHGHTAKYVKASRERKEFLMEQFLAHASGEAFDCRSMDPVVIRPAKPLVVEATRRGNTAKYDGDIIKRFYDRGGDRERVPDLAQPKRLLCVEEPIDRAV
jgi:hypothetical protein